MRRSVGDADGGRPGAGLRQAAAAITLGLVAMAPAVAAAGGRTDEPPGVATGRPAGSGTVDGRHENNAARDVYRRGVAAFDMGDNDAAILLLTEAIQLDPLLATAYAQRTAPGAARASWRSLSPIAMQPSGSTRTWASPTGAAGRRAGPERGRPRAGRFR